MNPKTIFGLTFKNNNVSKSPHISNVFKKSLDVLKSERIKGLDLKSISTKNKPLLRGRGNHHAYTPDNTGMVTVKSDVNLSHRLMGQAQPPMMVVRPQSEDIKTQLAQSEKVKHLQTFTQIEETENINHLAPYPLMDRAYPQIEEKVRPQTEVGAFTSMVEKSFISWNCSSPIEGWTFTPMMEAPFTPLGETSVHKTIAKLCSSYYPSRALSKILKLALVGYEYTAHTVRSMGFFCMCNISMHSHVMAELLGDAFECASFLYSWSTNPFQLCHLNYLVVIGKAPLNTGVHSHA